MDRDTEIFVQGFWVRCRETIRPELDHAVDSLKAHGHAAHVATQEYAAVPDRLPEPGPSLTLTVHPNHASRAATLQFRGDVAKADVIVETSNGTAHRHPLESLELPLVKAEISTFLADLLGPRR
ncbi:MAG: hypothetical protein JO339_00930 [Alphaproteobacteria bacterium]|nr:hypothetical protein [Alphaproteobacteria bacterium]